MTDFGAFLLVFAALAFAVALIRFFAWLTDVRESGGPRAYLRQRADRYLVNHSAQPAPVVMSRSQDEIAGLPAPSLQTDAQTDRQTAGPAPLPRDVMLDICKSLRAHGYSRDDARALLRKLGQPLDNNIWADAAPAPPAYVTPIAQRPTAAAFEDTPELRYEAPPA